MNITINKSQLHNYRFLNVDDDVFAMLTKNNRLYTYRLQNHHFVIRNKQGKEIPIWRLARRNFLAGCTCKYKDGNPSNLTRSNILIVRNK